MPKAANKVYAVLVGRGGPNIYNTWDECKEQVSRYPKAVHKSFPSSKQAREWLAGMGIPVEKLATPVSETSNAGSVQSPRRPPIHRRPDNEQPQKTNPGTPKIVLSPEQRRVLDRVKHGHSVFFTGSAGTGKSVLLRELIRSIRDLGKTLGVTASTGIAGVNIGGSTLHSWAGIGLGEQDPERYVGKFFGSKKFENVLRRWQETDALIIDEISMVDAELFDKLESIARGVRRSDAPFGGIQLVLSGDFFQLPPVAGRGKTEVKFAFEAKSWSRCVGSPVTLTRVFRQKDQAFVDVLNAMRFGKMDPKMMTVLQNLSRQVTYDDGIEPTELYPTRKEVDAANSLRIKRLQTESRVYQARDYPGVDSNGNRVNAEQMAHILERLVVPKTIQLKIGAQVMLVKNLVQGELVNGSVGQVVGFSNVADALRDATYIPGLEERRTSPGDFIWPVVRFINGQEAMCIPQEFTIDNADGSMEAGRDQVPLILAWALSVHKSQGQTLERVKVNLQRTFEKGQAYVALSRATSLDHLQVLNFIPSKVEVHSRVLEWYFGGKDNIIEISDTDSEDDVEILAHYRT